MITNYNIMRVNENNKELLYDQYEIKVKYYNSNKSAIALQIKDKTSNETTTLTINITDEHNLAPYCQAYINPNAPDAIIKEMQALDIITPVTDNNGNPVTKQTSNGQTYKLVKFNDKILKKYDPEGMRSYKAMYNAIRDSETFTPDIDEHKIAEESLKSYGYTNAIFKATDYEMYDAEKMPLMQTSNIQEQTAVDMLTLLKLKQAGRYTDELYDAMHTENLTMSQTVFGGLYMEENYADSYDDNPILIHQASTENHQFLICEFTIDKDDIKEQGTPDRQTLDNELIKTYQRAVIENENKRTASPNISINNQIQNVANNFRCIIIENIRENKSTNECSMRAIAVNGQEITNFQKASKGIRAAANMIQYITAEKEIPVIMTSSTTISVHDGQQRKEHCISSRNIDIDKSDTENYLGTQPHTIKIINKADAVGIEAIKAIAYLNSINKDIPEKEIIPLAIFTAANDYQNAVNGYRPTEKINETEKTYTIEVDKSQIQYSKKHNNIAGLTIPYEQSANQHLTIVLPDRQNQIKESVNDEKTIIIINQNDVFDATYIDQNRQKVKIEISADAIQQAIQNKKHINDYTPLQTNSVDTNPEY